MESFILFLNSFFSYLLVFVVSIVLILIGAVIGIKWRKSKDAKEKQIEDIDSPEVK